MFAASKTGAQASAAAPTDAKFNYVTMLLHGDGTNGAQNNTFLDSSSNAFTITRNGTPTQGTFSPYGSLWSNYFNGTSDTLKFASSGSAVNFTGAYTVECWFYLSSNLTYTGLFSAYAASLMQCGANAAIGGFGIYIYSANTGTAVPSSLSIATYGSATPSSLTATGLTIPINQWHHMAAVRDASNVTSLYLNGVRVASATISGSYASQNIEVGGDSDGVNYNAWFPGYISNMRVVKGTAVYDPTQTSLTVPTAPLTAVTNTSLLTCQSNRFKDSSTNNFAITVNGTPSVQRFSPFEPTSAYSTSTIGGSGYFNGTSDYLTVASSTGLTCSGDFTFETWLYASGNPSGSATIWSLTGGQTFQFSGGQTFVLYDGSTNRTFGTIPLNTWTHVAISRSGTTVYGFLNGVQAFSFTQSASYDFSGASFAYRTLAPTGYYWQGYLSNLRIVKGTALYTSAFTPPTAPLSAVTNTSLLLNFTNAGIYDNAMMNDLRTVGNAQVSTTQKKYGTGAMSFGGVAGDYLLAPSSVPFNLGTGDWTLEFWLYWPSVTTTDVDFMRFNIGTGLDWGIGIYNSASNLGIVDFNGATRIYFGSKNQIPTNQWVHIAFTRSGNTFRCFINGTIDSAGALTNTSSMFNNNTTAYFMRLVNGYVDDVRFTKGYARYTANFTPPTAALPDN